MERCGACGNLVVDDADRGCPACRLERDVEFTSHYDRDPNGWEETA